MIVNTCIPLHFRHSESIQQLRPDGVSEDLQVGRGALTLVRRFQIAIHTCMERKLSQGSSMFSQFSAFDAGEAFRWQGLEEESVQARRA